MDLALIGFFLLLIQPSFALPDFPSALFKTKRLSVPQPEKKIHSVIYGNSTYGYFESDHFSQSENEVVLKDFLPPGYQLPIEFFLKTKTNNAFHLEDVGSEHFKSPIPKKFKKAQGSVQGKLSSNYFLMGGFVEDLSLNFVEGFWSFFYPPKAHHLNVEGKKSSLYLFALNKLGEIVWIYFPSATKNTEGKFNAVRAHIHPLEDGKLGVSYLNRAKFSEFEIIDVKGRVFSYYAESEPSLSRHDFVYLKNNRILTLGYSVKYFPDVNPNSLDPDAPYLADTLQTIHLEKGTVKVHWSVFDFTDPQKEPDWEPSDRKRSVSVNDQRRGERGRNLKAYEFGHSNSIDELPGEGFLISMSSFNKLIFLDSKMKKVLWTVGRSSKNTYQLKRPEDYFQTQHHATFTAKDRILLFDNGRERSRVMELELNKPNRSVRVIKSFYPNLKLQTSFLGAAFKLDKNVVGYFPAPNPDSKKDPSYLMEFDYHSEKQVGQMKIFEDIHRASSRVVPAKSLDAREFDVSGLQKSLPLN